MAARILLGLAATVLIEAGVAWLWGVRRGAQQAALALLNLSTNLALNYVLLVLGWWQAVVPLWLTLCLEGVVVLVEWRVLVGLLGGTWKRWLLLAAAANALSFGFGLVVVWGGGGG